MAQVDFSNAILRPQKTSLNRTSFDRPYLALAQNGAHIINANSVDVANVSGIDLIVNAEKQFVVQYTGTFTASGTRFFISYGSADMGEARWMMDNVTFASGDTFVFQIKVQLT